MTLAALPLGGARDAAGAGIAGPQRLRELQAGVRQIPQHLVPFGADTLVPFRAGAKIAWRMV